jgi:hypothetical protein
LPPFAPISPGRPPASGSLSFNFHVFAYIIAVEFAAMANVNGSMRVDPIRGQQAIQARFSPMGS